MITKVDIYIYTSLYLYLSAYIKMQYIYIYTSIYLYPSAYIKMEYIYIYIYLRISLLFLYTSMISIYRLIDLFMPGVRKCVRSMRDDVYVCTTGARVGKLCCISWFRTGAIHSTLDWVTLTTSSSAASEPSAPESSSSLS